MLQKYSFVCVEPFYNLVARYSAFSAVEIWDLKHFSDASKNYYFHTMVAGTVSLEDHDLRILQGCSSSQMMFFLSSPTLRDLRWRCFLGKLNWAESSIHGRRRSGVDLLLLRSHFTRLDWNLHAAPAEPFKSRCWSPQCVARRSSGRKIESTTRRLMKGAANSHTLPRQVTFSTSDSSTRRTWKYKQAFIELLRFPPHWNWTHALVIFERGYFHLSHQQLESKNGPKLITRQILYFHQIKHKWAPVWNSSRVEKNIK